MKKIGIISAMPVEINYILENMILEKEIKICGFPFYIGSINNISIVLTTCSVGKVNAACCTQLLISNFDINYIINTGIAGGIYNKLKIKDIVISSDVTYYDVRQIQMKNCFPYQTSFKSSDKLVELYEKACKEILNIETNYYVGRIVTGDNFISTHSEKEKLKNELSAYCVEMEGAAIGHTAYINNIPFIIIRCISDLADENANTNYPKFEEDAALQSSKITLQILNYI